MIVMSCLAGRVGEVWPIMPVRNQQVRAVVRAMRMRPGVGVRLSLSWRRGVGGAELGFWSMGAVEEVGCFCKWLMVSGERRDGMADCFAVRSTAPWIYKYNS